jgi:subtilisin family serine protease
MQKRTGLAVGALLVGVMPISVGAAGAEQASTDASATEFVVLYEDGVDSASARAAIEAAGGTVVRENAAVGVATVVAGSAEFVTTVADDALIAGAARSRPIGSATPMERPKLDVVERLDAERDAAAAATAALPADAPAAGPIDEPLAHLQWDMRMIHATSGGSYATQQGDRGVVVAVIDTGVDGRHPDIAPNFDAARSRNFTIDIPLVDGPCEEEPDQDCTDPDDVDENGHGTHLASTIASPLNGLGIGGVAPRVTIVNARAGQDSGFFFLQPTVDALVHAADIGADVANMSFFIDPWLFNCAANPGDSPEEQLEQQTIIAATQRALDYAHDRGVTLVSAAGNEHTDLGRPELDVVSPDFPPETERERAIDNTCLTMPTEADHVIAVTAVGPSTRKAYYSNYGVEQADVAAPGGDFRDFPGTDLTQRPENLILAAYPESVARANEELEPDGTPNTPFVVRDCLGEQCAYYQWIQGTSMASPHAAGVAALIVSQYGTPSNNGAGGLTLDPDVVESVLLRTATDRPCPSPPLLVYPTVPPSFSALCEGGFFRNGFYGEGIVDAARAVNRFYGPAPG